MEPTTGGDANDEFARWLAETARAEQAAAQPPAAAPVPPAAAPVPPAAVAPTVPPSAAPRPPEFFGADQLAAPPTRPYEPELGGPQVARTSFQPPEAAPVAPAGYVTPTVLPPAAAPAAPPAAGAPATPAAPSNPAVPAPGSPSGSAPSWAPDYSAPGNVAPAPGVAVPPPAVSEPAVPITPPAVTPSPAAPAYNAPAAPPTAFFPDSASAAPAAPASQPAAAAPPAFPSSLPPVAAPPIAQQPVAPPPFDSAPFERPAAPAQPPAQPIVDSPPAAPAQPGSPSPSDPFGSLFETTAADDMAARLAASPPPSAEPPPPLVSPEPGELPADEDPLKSLFGLETEERPVIFEPAPAWENPGAEAPGTVVPGTPAATELPAFAAEPVVPVYEPEPAFAAASVGVPPASAVAPGASSSSYALTDPASAPADSDPTAGTQFFGGGTVEWEEPPNLDRTTAGERIAFVLAFIIPPVGLIASIVAAARSSRVRGWVHGFVRSALAISVITTIITGFAGAYFYKVLDDARKHDEIAAASAQFCAAVAADPSLVAPPAFGFPAPGASIPDTITAFQAYVDKWDALADVSPSGIRTDVTRVADSARDILDTVTTSHLVDDEQNQAVMSSVAGSTNVIGWSQEYCG